MPRPKRRPSTSAAVMAEAATWPIREAFAPVPGIWRATGCGSAGVIRDGPDGQVAAAIVDLQLINGGLVMAAGDVMPAAEARDFIALRESLPPRRRSSAEEAAAYAWGGWAFAHKLGLQFDRVQPLLALFGPPRAPRACLAGLRERTGERLLGIILRNFNPDLIDSQQEAMVIVEMTLRGSARDETLRRLRSQEEFGEEGDAGSFIWSREYPKDHWSPLAALGGRQVIGNLRVEDDGTVRASAGTLSMAARFAERLRELLGEPLEVVGAEWRDLREAAAGSRR